MPQIFKFGPYLVYFWSNENEPKEPIHVHISIGKPSKNSTKIWITKSKNKKNKKRLIKLGVFYIFVSELHRLAMIVLTQT